MSNLDHRTFETTESPYAEKYRAAMASIEAEKRRREASGYAWMASAMSYGEAAESESRFGKIARGAKWFVIWTAMIVPNLLFIKLVL